MLNWHRIYRRPSGDVADEQKQKSKVKTVGTGRIEAFRDLSLTMIWHQRAAPTETASSSMNIVGSTSIGLDIIGLQVCSCGVSW